jgi:lipoic acid synthetase
MRTKTGMMLGLGETKEEVIQSIQHLVDVGCDVLTLGQYLQPTAKHLPVQRFVHPDEFAELREIGYELGLDYVESGPLVRSSYHSEKHVIPGWGKSGWLMEQAPPSLPESCVYEKITTPVSGSTDYSPRSGAMGVDECR